VPENLRLSDFGGSWSLTLDCGGLPADPAISAAGHEPNGYFWEGVAEFLADDLVSRVDLDPEAGMFCARGDRAVLEQLREQMEPYVADPERIAGLIREAEAAGFVFDD
jgi:hypothetical protein